MTQTPTRRRLLRAVGAATAVSLAGCSSDDDDGTTTGQGATNGTTDSATRGATTGGGTETETAGETTDETTESTPEETTKEETSKDTTTGTEPPEGGGNVQFGTSGGATVRGTLLGDGSCGIVFAHDSGFDRGGWNPQMKTFAGKGYTCLAIDLNLDDESTTPEYVLAAVRYLRQRVGVENVVLVGAGAGANAVVRANAQAGSGTINGTLVLAPGKNADVASRMQGWKLFVVSSGDENQYVQTTKQMHQNASNPKRHEKVTGGAHGQQVFEANKNEMKSLLGGLLSTVCG
ncbi:alpha/beta hydrolase [Haladaptatus pallidirubidus]|uniref:Alpha/beta hydrolase n=1 Tax=Haladaptatus pallidirubidus TaxID=1008152 RepID=A0AAV3UFG6_9EURY|nr:alpha/beta hydrolase [Haladaptatus pallidirubidus]